MKKLLLSAFALFAFLLVSNESSAQSAAEAKARLAAIEAGCTGDYHGPLETSTNVIGTCDCGDGLICEYTEVLVTRKVNPHEAPYVRYAPFATVYMCGAEVQSVKCFTTY